MTKLDELTVRVAASAKASLDERCIDLDKLAERIGLSRADLDARLSGDQDFLVYELFRIADVIGASVTDLVGEPR